MFENILNKNIWLNLDWLKYYQILNGNIQLEFVLTVMQKKVKRIQNVGYNL